jgi:hypothetical protein
MINAYNPRSNGPRVQTWERVAEEIAGAEGEIIGILLGDFNAHHPQVSRNLSTYLPRQAGGPASYHAKGRANVEEGNAGKRD